MVCGIIGVVAGATDHTWKLEPIGWFMGGVLLALLAVFALLDGVIAASRRQVSDKASK